MKVTLTMGMENLLEAETTMLNERMEELRMVVETILREMHPERDFRITLEVKVT